MKRKEGPTSSSGGFRGRKSTKKMESSESSKEYESRRE